MEEHLINCILSCLNEETEVLRHRIADEEKPESEIPRRTVKGFSRYFSVYISTLYNKQVDISTYLLYNRDVETSTFKGLASKLSPYGYEPKRLIDSIWTGTAAMVKNDGAITNEKINYLNLLKI